MYLEWANYHHKQSLAERISGAKHWNRKELPKKYPSTENIPNIPTGTSTMKFLKNWYPRTRKSEGEIQQ